MIPYRNVSSAGQQLGSRGAPPQRQPSSGSAVTQQQQPFRQQPQPQYPPHLQQQSHSGLSGSASGGSGQQAQAGAGAGAGGQAGAEQLDPSDFPALGSQTWPPNSQLGPPGGSATSQQQQQSYASQAGTAVPAPPLQTLPPGPPSGLLSPALPSPGQQSSAHLASSASLTQDDFPALGGFDLHGHPNGSAQPNGLSLLGGSGGQRSAPGAAAPGQEQASAVAALQHQSQHRANLLGSMNGAGAPGQPSHQSRSLSGQFASETDKRQQGFNLKQGAPSQAPWPASTPTGLGTFPLPSPHFSSNPNPNGSASNNGSSILSPPQPPPPQRAVGGSSSAVPPSPASQAGSLPPPTPTGTGPASSSTATSTAPIQTPAQQVLFSPADRYGLLGLLHIIKTADPDLSMLALGSDLTTLGLDLGATDNLYSTFITPWSDSKAALALNIEPEFHLPSCYNVQPPPAGTKIGNFSDETLFFLFYNHPRDALQEMAAHELYKHNWRYHKDLRLWLTKEAGTEATQKTQSYERGSYIFFDPTLWERVRKDFVLVFESLESRRA